MGTTWNLQIADPISETKSKEVEALIGQELHSVEMELSHWNPNSDLSRWNQSQTTDWQPVPHSLAQTVTTALKIGKDTDGALNITMAPLIALWGFSSASDHLEIPSDKEMRAALQLTNIHAIEVQTDPPALKKNNPQVSINVASVTEGYVMDLLVSKLKQRGLKNFLLEIGGEVAAIGHAPDGRPWQVGLQAPDAAKGEILEAIPLADTCISTSGSYRHRYEKNGQTYSHLIDPRTGKPIEHHLVSVSVIHPSCSLADGYATALMILGPQKGREVAQHLGLRVIWLEEP